MNKKKSMGLGGSIVSKHLLDSEGELQRCVRDEAANPLDNGWRFFANIDTKEYLNDPDNMTVCDFGTVVDIEPAVLQIYDMPVGTDLMLLIDKGKRTFIHTDTGRKV